MYFNMATKLKLRSICSISLCGKWYRFINITFTGTYATVRNKALTKLIQMLQTLSDWNFSFSNMFLHTSVQKPT